MGAAPACRRHRRDPRAHDQHAEHSTKRSNGQDADVITAYRFSPRRARATASSRGGSGFGARLRAARRDRDRVVARRASRPCGRAVPKAGKTGRPARTCSSNAAVRSADLRAKTSVAMEPRRRDHRGHGPAAAGYGDPAERDPGGAGGARPRRRDREPSNDRRRRSAQRCANATIAGPPSVSRPDYVQANLIVVPSAYADELADLCARNPVPCPVLERLAPGAFEPACAGRGGSAHRSRALSRVARRRAGGAAARRARAVVRRLGRVPLGCSFTFDHALVAAGLTPRHYASRLQRPDVPHPRPARAAGRLRGTNGGEHATVQTRGRRTRCATWTRPYRLTHGRTSRLGRSRGARGSPTSDVPTTGDAPRFEPGEVPVFWGCGVTPQSVHSSASKLPFADSPTSPAICSSPISSTATCARIHVTREHGGVAISPLDGLLRI